MPNIYPNSQPQPYYGVNGKLTDDAKALPVPKKVFILDKSVLLYSPYAVFAFDEHTVTIPFNVIRDLDAIKKSQGESSRNAQEALSIIETLREKGNLRCGVPLENGGMFFVDDSSNETLLESAYSCMRHCPKESEIIVVSNSIATRIRMEESGFKAEVYRSDSVMTDTPYLGRTTAHCYDTEIDASGIPNEIPVSAVETDESLVENEFVTVKRADDSTIGVYQAKGKKLVRLNMDKMYPYGVRPKNLGQKMAIHALMDSLQSSSLTILMGDAGTAKTFLSLACGLEQTLGDDPKYRSVLVVRPNIKFDETVGFLKESEAEKINPLIRPILDNLDQLTAVKCGDEAKPSGDEKASVAEKAQDEEVHEPAEKPKAAEEMPAPQEVKEPAMDDTTEHEPISPIVTAMVNDSVSNETLDDIANVMNGVVKKPEAEQNEEPEQEDISEQCDQPIEEEQQPEAAPAEEVQEEPAASEESNNPVSEELPVAEPKSEEEQTEAVVDEEPVELTKFEQAMISLMKRGNIPENVYAIEEYKEGAVCLIRDDAHYFVYDCKDNQAQDVEMFEADKEKEIATTFATRIHEKLSKGA